MENVAIFIDYESLAGALEGEGISIDLSSLKDYLTEGRVPTEVFCYTGLKGTRNHEGKDPYRFSGMDNILIRSTEDNICIQLVLDVVDHVSTVKPDIVVIATGNENYAPLAIWLRLRGVRLEVASTPKSIPQTFRQVANGFIDVCQAINEIRGETVSPQREEVMTNGTGNR